MRTLKERIEDFELQLKDIDQKELNLDQKVQKLNQQISTLEVQIKSLDIKRGSYEIQRQQINAKLNPVRELYRQYLSQDPSFQGPGTESLAPSPESQVTKSSPELDQLLSK